MKSPPGQKESGNVMFYILIAVALLAALIFAVSQSGRGSMQQVSDEKAKLLADEILEYANGMGNAVAQLKLRNVREGNLCFDDPKWGNTDYNGPGCTDDANKVFHLSGGGITWKLADRMAMDVSATPDLKWAIYGSNEVYQVGTTCGSPSCSDLILVLDELSLNVCKKINGLLTVTDPDDAPPEDGAMDSTPYAGTFTYGQTIGDESTQLTGKTAGCFHESAAPGKYVFYKVLISR